MDLQESTLIQSGLTRNEVRVYLALLKLGSSTAIEITRKSKVHRVNVYDVLERLQEKGLISCVMQAHKRIYEAANPQQLLHLVKQKEQLVMDILPQLEQDFKFKKEKQQVSYFLGTEGLMRAYFMMLEQNATIFGIGGSGLNRQYLKHRHALWNKERMKRKIHMKTLYYEFTRQDKELGWQDQTVQIRYLPDKFKTLGMVDICGDLVINLLPIEGNVMAIVIENRVLADTYRQFFHFMWQYAPS